MHADFVFQLSPGFPPATGAAGYDQEFLARLDRELRPRMIASLQSRGASRDTAEDVASEIFSECVADGPRNLLRRYHGAAPMDGWLLRVALNRLVSRQRRERLVETTGMDGIDGVADEQSPGMEEALQGIVSKAVRDAIESLSAQTRLLLWLRHGYGIPQNRLCVCWRSTPSKLSRVLSSARETVRKRALLSIGAEEPGLHLEWRDISEVCADSVLPSESRHVA